MNEPLDVTDPAALAAKYMEVQSKIAELEGLAMLIKANIQNVLKPEALTAEQPAKWQYGDVLVQWVKGRKTDKLDKAVLKKELLLAGVAVEVVAGAFTKATTTGMGAPHLRIGGANGSQEEA
jgi:hypothetical protein